MASRVLSGISRRGALRHLIRSSTTEAPVRVIWSSSGYLYGLERSSLIRGAPCQTVQSGRYSAFTNAFLRRFGFSSSASPELTDKETKQSVGYDGLKDTPEAAIGTESAKNSSDPATPDQKEDAGQSTEAKDSKPETPRKRRKSSKRTTFSDSDAESDLSRDDLVKLVAEKDEIIKLQRKQNEEMKDKVRRTYAEMENVRDRTKREAENSKKFAIQSFAKSLLDVADNLGRASSVVKESFSKIDSSEGSVGAAPLLKTLLEGVDMTEKQLIETFRKFGVEKFDPMNEHFDPNRHHAVFQMPDTSKPPGTVAAVLKPGYMLHDRIIRPAEVGVTEASDDKSDEKNSGA